MRIITILTTLGIGGAEKQALCIAEGMAARGNELLLLVLLPAQQNQWQTSLRTIHLNVEKSPSGLLRGLLRARKIVADFNPHIVHSHTYPANIFARLLKLCSRRFRLIATIHNTYEGGFLRMLAYRLTDFLCNRVTAVSTAAAQRFIRLGAVPEEKIQVLTNGIDVEKFSPAQFAHQAAAPPDKKFTWLATGRITPAKDYSNLLRAFAIVQGHAPHTLLRIAGEQVGDEQQRLCTLAAVLGIAESVEWLGLCNNLPQLMADADGFVLSSAWEGMPLALGEAMAMGLPVVATDVGGVRELAGDCAAIVPPKDPAALAERMLSAQTMSEKERTSAANTARQRIVEKFNIRTRIKEWAEVYVDIFYRRERFLFIAPLIAAALIRLILLLAVLLRTGLSALSSGDTMSYLLPGVNLLHIGRFFNLNGPELDRTPGYPLFLALTAQHGFLFAALAQIVLSVFTIWLVARIAYTLFAHHPRRRTLARLAAWLMVFEPLSVAYSIKLYPETLFLFFLLLTVYLLLRFLSRRSLTHLTLAAISLAAATYIKPITLYLPLFVAFALLLYLRRTARLRWQAPLVILLFSIALIMPWQLRNQRVAGFNGFTSVQQKNLYFFQAAGLRALMEDRPFDEVQHDLGYPDSANYLAAHPEQTNWSQSERLQFQAREATRILLAHPLLAAYLQLKGTAIVALTPGTAGLFDLLGLKPHSAPSRLTAEDPIRASLNFARINPIHALIMAVVIAYLLWLYWHAILALCSPIYSTQFKSLFILLIAYFLLLSGGAQAVGRYRLPIMPLVCILAAGTAAGRRLNSVERGTDDWNYHQG